MTPSDRPPGLTLRGNRAAIKSELIPENGIVVVERGGGQPRLSC